MSIAFAGTPDFAARLLDTLIQTTPHRVSLVFTQPDRPAGRGRKLTPSPVKQVALEHGLSVLQPSKLDRQAVDVLRHSRCDVAVVAAYGLILPGEFLRTPKHGCLNVHASLLPRWRGAAPIQRAILAGDDRTGISIMQMDEGLDTGDILAVAETVIEKHDTAGSLHDRLVEIAAPLMVRCLADLQSAQSRARVQDAALATYAGKINKREAEIDWRHGAEQIARQVRAFNPWPVAYTTLRGERLKIYGANAEPEPCHQPGVILQAANERLAVGTGCGVLVVDTIQRAGARRMKVAEFLNASPLTVGDRLGG